MNWRQGSPSARVAATVLLLLGSFPFVDWIRGGHQAEWYGVVLAELASGSAIVVGGAVVLVILSRKRTGLWRNGLWTRWAGWWWERGWRADLLLAAVALACYSVIAAAVFSAKPLLIDEIIQVFQARLFADGKLWIPAPAHPEFFSSLHVIDTGGKMYGQFPPGGPAMLVPGTLLGAEWLAGPVFGAVSVLLFARLVRQLEARPGSAVAASVLFAFAPYVAFMAGTHMNHVPTMTWLLLATLGLAHLTRSTDPSPRAALVVGLGLGLAATIRPVDAMAFALPAGAWLMLRTCASRTRWSELAAAGVALALPVCLMLWVNQEQTGNPLQFGYTVLWGESQGLGFHSAPWGVVHSPLRGLELLNLYLLRLQTYLLETPVPSLLWATVALFAAGSVRGMDRYLLASGGLLAGLYFAYWHDGFFLGPRFMYCLAPLLVLWTARCIPLLKERGAPEKVWRGAVYMTVLALLLALGTNLPLRWRQYAAGFTKVRWDVDAQAAAAGVENALVLVRESWGAQVLARLWARGVSRSESEHYYRSIDTCRLDEALDSLERSGGGGDVRPVFRAMLADSARLIASPVSPDYTERVDTTRAYHARCFQRIAEDRKGFMAYPPLLLAGKHGNIFARDLHARDTLLLQQFPGRSVYLLRPATTQAQTEPVFEQVMADSLQRTWTAEQAR